MQFNSQTITMILGKKSIEIANGIDKLEHKLKWFLLKLFKNEADREKIADIENQLYWQRYTDMTQY